MQLERQRRIDRLLLGGAERKRVQSVLGEGSVVRGGRRGDEGKKNLTWAEQIRGGDRLAALPPSSR